MGAQATVEHQSSIMSARSGWSIFKYIPYLLLYPELVKQPTVYAHVYHIRAFVIKLYSLHSRILHRHPLRSSTSFSLISSSPRSTLSRSRFSRLDTVLATRSETSLWKTYSTAK